MNAEGIQICARMETVKTPLEAMCVFVQMVTGSMKTLKNVKVALLFLYSFCRCDYKTSQLLPNAPES